MNDEIENIYKRYNLQSPKKSIKKPLGWYYHKIMCELWYNIEGYGKRYHKHLMIMYTFYEIDRNGNVSNKCDNFKHVFKTIYNNFFKRL